MPQPVSIGTTYWPADVGPYMWHEFSSERSLRDLTALRRLGFTRVRVHLAWDAFMPTPRQVNRARLGNLESLLRTAATLAMTVVPVLFAQTIGDVIMLPDFAVDHRRPPGACRVVRDTTLDVGAPRDIYADPLMLEAQVTMLETLLSGFANHPAIAAWDLGHDPATAVRPRHIRDISGWAEELGGRVRRTQDRCCLTLGVGDLIRARGVRLAPLAAVVDAIGIAVMPQRLRLDGHGPRDDDVVFLAQLAQRLAAPAELQMELAVAAGTAAPGGEAGRRDPGVMAEPAAARAATAAIDTLAAVGVAAIGIWPSHQLGERLVGAPPFDRMPSLRWAGLIGDQAGARCAAWAAAAADPPERTAAAAWPEELDVEAYYAGLPDSLMDLHSQWRRGQTARPDILS